MFEKLPNKGLLMFNIKISIPGKRLGYSQE